MKKQHRSTQQIEYLPEIIHWVRKPSDKTLNRSLIQRIPGENQSLKKTKGFTVKEHERAILLQNGEFISEMESGTYELAKDARKPGTEIIWIDTTTFQLPWGISQLQGVRTLDGFEIGMHGEIKLALSHPLYFYKYVVGGNLLWTVKDLKHWISGMIHTSLRDVFKHYSLTQIFQEDRENVKNALLGKIIEDFDAYGIELKNFELLGIKTPPVAQNILDHIQNATLISNQIHQQDQFAQVEAYDRVSTRIASLKQRQRDLEDELIDQKISNDEFKSKNNVLKLFLEESEKELILIRKNTKNLSFPSHSKLRREDL